AKIVQRDRHATPVEFGHEKFWPLGRADKGRIPHLVASLRSPDALKQRCRCIKPRGGIRAATGNEIRLGWLHMPYGNVGLAPDQVIEDRKSTRLNSSHVKSSYAVFCLKKKSSTIQYSCSTQHLQ